jgi:hypothetical protein
LATIYEATLLMAINSEASSRRNWRGVDGSFEQAFGPGS